MRERDGNEHFDPLADIGKDSVLEEDPFFNADEIAFQVRLQCHRERKTFVRRLGSNVQTKPPTPKTHSIVDINNMIA